MLRSKFRILSTKLTPTQSVFHQKRYFGESSEEERKNVKATDGLGLTLLALGGLGGLTYYFLNTQRENLQDMKTKRANISVEQYGKPEIGGPFTLINGKDGSEVTEKILEGKWTLMYFGFNFCPDICPEEMEKMSDAYRMLKRMQNTEEQFKNCDKVQGVYITIDPKRDTPKIAYEYATSFNKNFIGLGGSFEQIEHATKQFRIYYVKVMKFTIRNLLPFFATKSRYRSSKRQIFG